MPDTLISAISECSLVQIAASAIGRPAFSIDCLVSLNGAEKRLVLGRPFDGIDDKLWGILENNLENYVTTNKVIQIYVEKVVVSLQKLHSKHQEIDGQVSIEELSFTDARGQKLRFYGDADDFAVPCINCEIVTALY